MTYDCPIRASAKATPAAVALVFEGRAWTYAQLDEWVSDFHARLLRDGVGARDRVAVLSPNRPEVVALFFAVRRAGALLAPLNVRLHAREISSLHARLRAKLTLSDASFAQHLPFGATFEQWLAAPAKPAPAPEPREGGEGWVVLFTSGTTGAPKAAELTIGNFEASARLSGKNLGDEAAQVWLGALPLFHIGGLAMAARTVRYGGKLVLLAKPQPDVIRMLLQDQGITHASLVPQSLEALLSVEGPPFPKSLRAILIGGAPAHSDLLERARAAGLPVVATYGLTEATSQVSTERVAEADGATAGQELDGLFIRIVDVRGAPAKLGVEGEIEVQGPTVMRGYFENPVATAETFRGAWLRTHDVGRLDDLGRLTVLARRTDLILSGGENIYPAEVEAVLLNHPAVSEAAVVAEQDARWGEAPAAFVVAKRGKAISTDELQKFVMDRMASFKAPKRYEQLTELPKTALGKIDRSRLKEMLSK